MPTRRLIAAAALALGAWPGLVLAQDDDGSAAVAGRRDRSERLSVPVMIGEAGPFAFVVDCGADRSVLADDLAASLGLPPGADVMIHGITGAQRMSTVRAPALRVGGLALRGGDLPVLPRERLGADGLLGVDALAGRRLVLDFQRLSLEIGRPSSDEAPIADRGEAYVTARSRFGLLTIVDAQAAGRRVNVFVDSGGGVTVANQAMAAAVRRRGDWLDAAPMVELTGVTEHVMSGELRVLDRLELGDLSFETIPMVVSDLHVFDRGGLRDEPTILLGANVLRLFARVELDYRRRRILFRSDGRAETLLA